MTKTAIICLGIFLIAFGVLHFVPIAGAGLLLAIFAIITGILVIAGSRLSR